MNLKSRLLALTLALSMFLVLTACGGKSPSAQNPAQSPSSDTDTFVVGVCQLLPHTALDAATQGFIAALEAELGDKVRVTVKNAGGEPNNCATIVDGFLAEGVDLILANATPALTAAAAATDTVPILGTAITNYGVALSLDSTADTVIGGNISGTSDLAPLDQQAAMVQELFPNARQVGLLYCSSEANSLFQVNTIQSYLEAMGYTCTQYAFTDVNDLAAATETAASNSDVIYIPTDNTAADNAGTIANVVLAAGVPVVAGEAGLCGGCGVATLSISYYELGEITGRMAAQVLTGAVSIDQMPIAYDTTLDKLYNPDNCKALNVSIPDDYAPLQ